MKALELREKTKDELVQMLIASRKKQFGFRMQKGSGQPVRPSEERQIKKDVARIKTVLKEKEQENSK